MPPAMLPTNHMTRPSFWIFAYPTWKSSPRKRNVILSLGFTAVKFSLLLITASCKAAYLTLYRLTFMMNFSSALLLTISPQWVLLWFWPSQSPKGANVHFVFCIPHVNPLEVRKYSQNSKFWCGEVFRFNALKWLLHSQKLYHLWRISSFSAEIMMEHTSEDAANLLWWKINNFQHDI